MEMGRKYRAPKRLEPGLEPGAGWESDALPTELQKTLFENGGKCKIFICVEKKKMLK